MGNRSITDSRSIPDDRTLPNPLRNEWRPASEFNNGLGDRERSWSPDHDANDTEDDHWDTHLTTISPELLNTSRNVLPSEPLDGPVHPSTSSLHLPATSTSNPNNYCEDDDEDHDDNDDASETDNLESIVQRYRETATGTDDERELRSTRELARDVRAMAERFMARQGHELSARERDQLHMFLERVRRFDVELGPRIDRAV